LDNDRILLKNIVNEFCEYFSFDADGILEQEFSKIIPVSYHPYGRLYSY
jgi:hypothetical protein